MRLAATLVIFVLLRLSSRAADVRFVQVSKAVSYVQTNAAAPVLQTNAYQFRVRVDLARADSVAAISVKWPPPSNITRSLANQVSYWEYSQSFPSSDGMNLLNPNSSYTVLIQAGLDGKRTNVLTLSADTYPNPVHIANFAAAQKINANGDFTLQWDPPGTAAGDIIQVRIFSGDQVVLETGSVPGVAGTLSGSASSFVIPKNTLRDGTVYRAQVIAIRKSTSDATGYPGVPAWASYSRLTEFAMRTIYPTLDLSWYGVAKLRRFTQNSVLAPTPESSGAYKFSAFAAATDPLNLLSASLTLPNGTAKLMAAAGADWSVTDTRDTTQQLDSIYGSGTYQLDLQTTHNGPQRLQLPLNVTAFPLPLQIINWNDASVIDPAQPFTLKWAAIPGANADDFIQVTVRKNGIIVFRSPGNPLATGALNGSASAVTFPAALLQPGEAAEVTLSFLKALSLDLVSYPQALGTAASGCETRATIRAAGGNIAAANLSAARASNGNLEFSIVCAEGRQQVLQISRDFTHWTDALITNAPSSSFLLRVPINSAERAIGVRVRTN